MLAKTMRAGRSRVSARRITNQFRSILTRSVMHIAGYAPPSHGLLVVLDRLTGLVVQARDGDRLALSAAIRLSQAEVCG